MTATADYGPFLIKLSVVFVVVLLGGFILQTVTTGPESCSDDSLYSNSEVGALIRENGDVIWEVTEVNHLSDGSDEVCGRIPGIFKRL